MDVERPYILSHNAYKALVNPVRQIETTKIANPLVPLLNTRETPINYVVGYKATYRGANGVNYVDPPYYLPDFKLVDVIPSSLSIQSITPEPWFTELGGTVEQEPRADGTTIVTFRLPQAPNGNRTVARITTKMKASTPSGVTLSNRIYVDFNNPSVTHLNAEATPEEGNEQLSTATYNTSLYLSNNLTGEKFIRKSSSNGPWVEGIETLPNEEFEYKIVVSNNLDFAMPNIQIFDLLPYQDDRYSVADGLGRHLLRGSWFHPNYVSVESVQTISNAGVIQDVSAQYPITLIKSRAGFPQSASDGTTKAWVEATLANPSMLTTNPNEAVALHLGTSASSIPANSRLEIVFKMRNPNFNMLDSATWDGKKAYNTFAYLQGTANNYIEPNRVSNTLDTPKKNIALRKVDSVTGEVLVGARFRLVQNGVSYYATSNAAGMVYFNNLEYAPYTINEVTAPTGYRLNTTVISRSLSLQDYLNEIADPTYVEPVVDFPNEKILVPPTPVLYDISIHKKNGTNNLANVRFELENLQTNTIVGRSTNASGLANFTNLTAGQYTLREISNLQGFTLIDPLTFDLPLSAGYIAASAHPITLDDTDNMHLKYSFEIQNNTFELSFIKIGMKSLSNPGGGTNYVIDTRPDNEISSSEGTKLSGVRFGVYRTNKLSDGTSTADPTETHLYDIVTDSQGQSKLRNLEPGRIYLVRELSTPAGYDTAPDAEFYVNDAGVLFTPNHENYVRNNQLLVSNKETPKKGSITLNKVDAQDSTIKLAGVVFKLYKLNTASNTYEAVSPDGEIATGTDGIARFSDLEYGSYRVMEITPKNGYISRKEPIDFVVRPYTESIYTRTIQNRKFNIIALKVEFVQGPYSTQADAQAALDALVNAGADPTELVIGENNIYRKLRGARFELRENVTTGSPVVVAADVSPANDTEFSEYHYSSNLKANGSYTLVETQAPDGYDAISPQVLKIDLLVNYNNPSRTVYVRNERSRGQVVITKYDSRAFDVLPGAEFEIYAGHHDTEADLAALTPVATGVSDSNGSVRFLNLVYGPYTIRESSAPAGFQRIAGVTKITINSSTPTVRRTYYNRLAVTDLRFRKVDDTGNVITNLAGSRFVLTVNGNPHSSAEYPASMPGHIVFKDVPIEGVFVLTEEIAPDNYAVIGTGTLTLTHTSANPLDVDPANNPVVDFKNKLLINIQAKKTWVGGDDIKDARPEVYFKLFRKTATTVEEAVNTNITRVGKENATVTMGTLLSQSPDVYERFDKYLHKADGTVEEYQYYVKEVDSAGALLDMADYEYVVTGRNTLELTNTYKAPQKSLTVNKQWTDGETLTKPNLQFVLFRKIASDTSWTALTVAPQNVPTSNGAVSFANLDTTDANGNVYTYMVRERKADGTPLDSTVLFQPEGGAEKEVAANATDFELNFNNKYESSKMQVTGTKTWVNGPSLKPDVYFKLYRYIAAEGIASAVEVPNSLKVVDSTSNQVTWASVEQSDSQGRNYTYFVREADSSGNLGAPDNYELTESGMGVTNTYKSPKINLEVKKTWDLVAGEARPASIRVKFTRSINATLDAGFERTEQLLASDNWEKAYTGFDATNENGIVYDYHIEELDAIGYDVTKDKVGNLFNLVNKQKLTTRSIKKVWVNTSSDPTPSSVRVRILRDGVAYGTDVVLNAANNWEHTFSNLPAYAPDQNAYLYTFEEDVPGGYTPSFTPDPLNANTVILTNTLSSTSVEVTKTWVDAANSLDKPSRIRIILDRNGVEYKDHQLEADVNGDWKHTFTGLPERDSRGNLYVYTVREIVPAGYQAVVTNYSITNTRILLEYRVNKTWQDPENAYPGSITFRLHRDGVEVNAATVTLAQATANGNWNHLFTEDSAGFKLPKTNPTTGRDYVYTVSEDSIPGFDAEINGNSIINKRKINVVTARKVWIGGRKPATTLLLKRKTVDALGVETVDASFTRSFTVSAHVTSRDFRLPEFDGTGNRYIYFVEEPVVPDNYVLTINGTTATNRYVAPRVSITAEKRWDGKFTVKPPVWFKLYRHLGLMVGTEEVPVPVVRVYGTVDRVTWNNLPETNSNGDIYHYFVREVNPSGEDYTPLGFEKVEHGLVVVNVALDMKAPKTGDSTNIWLLLALALGSSLGAGLVLLRRRKEQ